MHTGSAPPNSGVRLARRLNNRERFAPCNYLGLAGIVAASCGPTIILGDFNQTHPRKRQPRSVHSALEHAILSRLNLSTGGSIAGSASQAIDHIAHSSDFEAGSVSTLSNIAASGTQLSDHFGVTARFTVARR